MAERFDDWDDVAAFALSLPGASMEDYYDKRCPKVNGKMFVSPGREPGSFHVRTTHDEKALLIETGPEIFWQTPHYEGWPGLLVRYGSPEAERIRNVIIRAWWSRANKAQRDVFGERP